MQRRVPRPDQIRTINGSFAWIDHRLIRNGHLEGMSLEEIALYVFLVLAADRSGVSFYRKDVISNKLGIDWDRFEFAKKRLIEKRLIAFEPFRPGQVDGFFQVLGVPEPKQR
jgi:hypothetical protein